MKQGKAQERDCQFFLHHFIQADDRQLEALIKGLNRRADVHGIVLQLPLPKNINRQKLIDTIDPTKDIDNLRGDAGFIAPTAGGIVDLLNENNVNPAKLSTLIIGGGLLVGAPLAELWRQNGWPFEQIFSEAENHESKIRAADLVISGTGVTNLITPAMVRTETILVDGSGVDVNVKELEPLVKLITPAKGAVGPLTVTFLFSNLLQAADRPLNSAGKTR